MATFRLLHLSDFHQGTADQPTLWPRVKSCFFEDLTLRRKEGPPWDAVVFTGDIAQTGSEADYHAFVKTLDSLWSQLRRLGSNPTLIAIPGNHDLSRPSALTGTVRALLRWHDDEELAAAFWSNRSNEYRRLIDNSFFPYMDWRRGDLRHARVVDGILPGDIAATIPLDGMTVGLVGLNTSYLQLTSAHFAERLHVDVRQLQGVLGTDPDEWFAQHDFALLLTHHPPDWLHQSSRRHFMQEIFDPRRFAVHLYGHMHEHKQTSIAIGGGTARNYMQAASLFGLEHWRDATGSLLKRTHGYSDILFTQHHDRLTIEHYPRILEFADDAIPPRMIPNHRQFFLEKERALITLARPPRTILPPVSGPTLPLEQKPPRADSVRVIEPPSQTLWHAALRTLGILSPTAQFINESAPGVFDFRDNSPPHLVRCISAPGHILSEREVESINTLLDKSDYSGTTVISLTELEPAARILADTLSRKKNFTIYGPKRLAQALESRLTRELRTVLETARASEAALSLLLREQNILAVLNDRLKHEWFYVLDSDGQLLQESDPCISRLRQSHIELAGARYGKPGKPSEEADNSRPPFAREEYLLKAYEQFSALNYSATAPIGLRFPQMNLLDVYVAPSAELAALTQRNEDLRQKLYQAILDTVELDETQRKQLDTFFASGAILQPAETDLARRLYHQHQNIVLLGDPGSGKTCFVKREILFYCNAEETSWYRFHTPVFISLAEAAPLLDEEHDILDVATELAARKGLHLPRTALDVMFAQGTLAFFLDGLDEVGSLSQRASIVSAVSRLVEEGGPRGNRFVITSRPAAVHHVKLPDLLRTLQLKGLSDAEIRALATKLVSAEFVRGGERVRYATSNEHGKQLVDRLLADCAENPGIGRLARNPFLLTLLMTIYANTGALAAKRHRVYEQAVVSLVTVRNRADGGFAHSESDLRHRLGRVALSAFRMDAPFVSKGQAVAEVEAAIRQEGREPSRGEASAFLQSVAEVTGVLVLSKAGDDASVAFMHHSFLEYYTAVGLLASHAPQELADLFSSMRWRDVLSLCAGILGDKGNVTPLIAALCQATSPVERVLRDRLLFAIECALECDVPPEEAQRRIAASTHDSMVTGPGRIDASFRQELGSRLGRLLVMSGSRPVIEALRAGVSTADARVAAAYMDLVASIASHVELPRDLHEAFDAALNRPEGVVRIAALRAVAAAPQLRSPSALKLVSSSLGASSSSVQYAATDCVVAIPSLAPGLLSKLEACLDSPMFATSASAARALLQAGVSISSADRHSRVVLERCLHIWEAYARFAQNPDLRLELEGSIVRRLLGSSNETDNVLAIRLLPWLDGEERYAYGVLRGAIRESARPRAVLAALASLRLRASIRALLTGEDIDHLFGLLGGRRDVRTASLRLLGVVPLTTAQLGELRRVVLGCDWSSERELVACLAEQAKRSPDGRTLFFELSEIELSRQGRGRSGGTSRQQEILGILAGSLRVSGPAPRGFLSAVNSLANNYKTPRDVRRYAFLSLCHLSPPTSELLDRVTIWLSTMSEDYWVALASGLRSIVRNGRESPDWQRSVSTVLDETARVLAARWQSLAAAVTTRHDDRDSADVRGALRDAADVSADAG